MQNHAAWTQAQLASGQALFADGARFVAGIVSIDALPETGKPEIAIAGRSNVGKSSLVNALTRRRSLAHISKTPGRTRQLNYYDVSGQAFLVDLPGFGYAQAPKTQQASWRRLIDDYLRGRSELRRLLLLIDARRGVGKIDRTEMDKLNNAAISWQIVLTKMDKLKPDEQEKAVISAKAVARSYVSAHPVPLAVSSRNGTGMETLRAEIAALSSYAAAS